jgi:protein-S-isoprenylcysteine O-methyltransferase Ste14
VGTIRWLMLGLLVAALTVSGFHRARARVGGDVVARQREGPLFLVLRALGALALFGSVLACVFAPEAMGWAAFSVPMPVRWIAVALGALDVLAIHWVLATLGRNVTETVLTKERHELVTSGPYRWLRHPLYTTGLSLFLAFGLMAGNWFILLAAGITFILLRVLVIPREERALVAKFGERYRAYMERTGRLMPKIGGGRVG